MRLHIWPKNLIQKNYQAEHQPQLDREVLRRYEIGNTLLLRMSPKNEQGEWTEAAARQVFSDDGHNALMMGNYFWPSHQWILGDLNEAWRCDEPGWHRVLPYWLEHLQAIKNSGRRLDAIYFDIEQISRSVWGRSAPRDWPEGKPYYPSDCQPIKDELLNAVQFSRAGMPDFDYGALFNPRDPLHYDEVNRYHQTVLSCQAWCMKHFLVEPAQELFPDIECTQYKASDFKQPIPRKPGSLYMHAQLPQFSASSPELYHGLQEAYTQLRNITGPVVPWNNADSPDFLPILNICEAHGCETALVWGEGT